MRVKEAMEPRGAACGPDATLTEAAALLWREDDGAAPVVAEDGHLVGMITDRDICLAVGIRRRPASELRVREIITGKIWTCRPDHDVREALRQMARREVRMLPVTDADGRLVGCLSITAILRRAEELGDSVYRTAARTLRRVCEPRKVPIGLLGGVP